MQKGEGSDLGYFVMRIDIYNIASLVKSFHSDHSKDKESGCKQGSTHSGKVLRNAAQTDQPGL